MVERIHAAELKTHNVFHFNVDFAAEKMLTTAMGLR